MLGVVQMSDRLESADLRDVFGHFPSGVVVVTAVGPDGPIGFTCQSFSSLSLEPPLVSFSVARTSRTWPAVRRVGSFCVNVLADDHEHHSAGFARSGVDKFAGVDWTPAPSGAPILEDVCAWFDCELHDVHPGGDHEIVVGAVRALEATGDRRPLVFHRGAYGVRGARVA